jgi:hypothetical protein
MSKVEKAPTADEIAEMASRGEDISPYFTNAFTVVRPISRGPDEVESDSK